MLDLENVRDWELMRVQWNESEMYELLAQRLTALNRTIRSTKPDRMVRLNWEADDFTARYKLLPADLLGPGKDGNIVLRVNGIDGRNHYGWS